MRQCFISFKELVSLVDELGASGVIINCLGVSYYMDRDILRKFHLEHKQAVYFNNYNKCNLSRHRLCFLVSALFFTL